MGTALSADRRHSARRAITLPPGAGRAAICSTPSRWMRLDFWEDQVRVYGSGGYRDPDEPLSTGGHLVTISVILFVIQYTLSAPWYTDPLGRTIIIKDIARLFLLVPSCIMLAWRSALTPLESQTVGLISVFRVAATMTWRSVVWWKIQRPWPFGRKASRHENGRPPAEAGSGRAPS